MVDDDANDPPFGSDHPGGVQFVFVGGHVEFDAEFLRIQSEAPITDADLAQLANLDQLESLVLDLPI